MNLFEQNLPGLKLQILSIQQRWGATFEDALFLRHDGSFQLRMTTDHPEFEDETFELTGPEGQEWTNHMDGGIVHLG